MKGICESEGSLEGVDGRDGVGVFLPDPGSGTGATRGEAWAESIHECKSSSSSTGGTAGAPFPGDPFIGKCGFLTLANVEVEGGRDTCFCGVMFVGFRENQPDFF